MHRRKGLKNTSTSAACPGFPNFFLLYQLRNDMSIEHIFLIFSPIPNSASRLLSSREYRPLFTNPDCRRLKKNPEAELGPPTACKSQFRFDVPSIFQSDPRQGYRTSSVPSFPGILHLITVAIWFFGEHSYEMNDMVPCRYSSW